MILIVPNVVNAASVGQEVSFEKNVNVLLFKQPGKQVFPDAGLKHGSTSHLSKFLGS